MLCIFLFYQVIQERQKVLDAKTADQIVDNDNTIGKYNDMAMDVRVALTLKG